ncbi:hypothetical protein C7444_114107 [Sphaerotilus hippei]|uniref:Uncharacterized protein n=1 Tax=Sphaerotilus hippei TaxID=744406 RepID=A0A318GXA2_9BURK|nr:hypothetical protein [Sphaerotilus hippei]PXW94408.1 hypothetical protein C7444_114107 [Sphaerotilus hippei]
MTATLAIDATALDEALGLAEAAATVREAAAALRTRFAPMRIVVVDAFDMRAETPAAQGERRALYLGASDGHCWQVTADPARAVGFFISDRG